MKKLLPFLLLILSGCSEVRKIALTEADLIHSNWICQAQYANGEIRSTEILSFFEDKHFQSLGTRFYVEGNQDLELNLAPTGNWTLSGNKITYFIDDLNGRDHPLSMMIIGYDKRKFLEQIEKAYPNDPSNNQRSIVEMTISEPKKGEFKFAQKISSYALRAGVCMTAEVFSKQNSNEHN